MEYVSANPTGDLHIGHGRNGVFGSCLANLLSFAGFQVEQEFYINDTGEQIFQLGQCAWALYQRSLDAKLPIRKTAIRKIVCPTTLIRLSPSTKTSTSRFRRRGAPEADRHH